MNDQCKNCEQFSFGGIASKPDYRDVPLAAVVGAPAQLPEFYFADISALPVWHQKKIGACVGHASAKKKQKADYDETKQVIPLSARFVYAMAKKEDGLPAGFQGTYYRLGVKIMQKYGCATEATVPNNTDLSHEEYIDTSKFLQTVFSEAEQYAIKSYARVALDEQSLKQGIMEGGGVLIGMQLGNEWWTAKDGRTSWAEQDILPLRPPKAVVSGHAIFLFGWDAIEGRTRLWFRNSWSDAWGQKGNGYFFYDEHRDFLTEAWTFVDLPNDWQKETKDLPPAETFRHYFGQDIVFDQSGDEVRQLQIALKIDGAFPKTVAETGYYGKITQQAVKDFQAKYKVASWLELLLVNGRRVGAKTRLKLNELFNK